MIEDIVVSIGRVGTLAAFHFLQSSPEITPTSWFDLPTVRQHWAALKGASRRFLVMVHHSSELSILDTHFSFPARVTWNTRCPFKSARSSINWRIFQDIIAHDGVASRPWTEMIEEDDLCGFYPSTFERLRKHDLLIIDVSEISGQSKSGYQKLAQHHGVSMNLMEVPQGVQSGDFETFLFSYRFLINGISYMIVPAKGITWLRKDMHIGSIDGKDIFPEYYGSGRIMSIYAEMDRPDSQWKKEFCWENFLENTSKIKEISQEIFDKYRNVYMMNRIEEDDYRLDVMVNRAFGYSVRQLVNQVPVFQTHWNTGKISSQP